LCKPRQNLYAAMLGCGLDVSNRCLNPRAPPREASCAEDDQYLQWRSLWRAPFPGGPRKERVRERSAPASIRAFGSGRQLGSNDGLGCGGSTQCVVFDTTATRNADQFFPESGYMTCFSRSWRISSCV